jgi:hypothetical protein
MASPWRYRLGLNFIMNACENGTGHGVFASLPGALPWSFCWSSSGADMWRVTISQSVRLFFLDTALLGYCVHLASTDVVTSNSGGSQEIIVRPGLAVTTRCLRLRVPAGLILGPCQCRPARWY